MKLPISVTFRGMDRSLWVEADIRRRATRLDDYCSDIMSCRVVVDIPHRHHEEGNRFRLRIDLTVPDGEFAVTRDANLHASKQDLGEEEWVKQFDIEGTRKDIRLVIREAFDVARRQLQDYARRHRLKVKRHEDAPRGKVIRWSQERHFGTIEAADGHELYFHQNSVIGNGLKRLRVGAKVAFVEEQGDKGPQASTVRLVHPRRQRVVAVKRSPDRRQHSERQD